MPLHPVPRNILLAAFLAIYLPFTFEGIANADKASKPTNEDHSPALIQATHLIQGDDDRKAQLAIKFLEEFLAAQELEAKDIALAEELIVLIPGYRQGVAYALLAAAAGPDHAEFSKWLSLAETMTTRGVHRWQADMTKANVFAAHLLAENEESAMRFFDEIKADRERLAAKLLEGDVLIQQGHLESALKLLRDIHENHDSKMIAPQMQGVAIQILEVADATLAGAPTQDEEVIKKVESLIEEAREAQRKSLISGFTVEMNVPLLLRWIQKEEEAIALEDRLLESFKAASPTANWAPTWMLDFATDLKSLRPELAKELLVTAEAFASNSPNYYRSEAYTRAAEIAMQLGDDASAEKNALSAFQSISDHPNPRVRATALFQVAGAYAKSGKPMPDSLKKEWLLHKKEIEKAVKTGASG